MFITNKHGFVDNIYQVSQPRRSRVERIRQIAAHHRTLAETHNALVDLYEEEAARLEVDFGLE